MKLIPLFEDFEPWDSLQIGPDGELEISDDDVAGTVVALYYTGDLHEEEEYIRSIDFDQRQRVKEILKIKEPYIYSQCKEYFEI